MREVGIDLVSLWVLRENIGARRFYERCGRSFNGEERREELWGSPQQRCDTPGRSPLVTNETSVAPNLVDGLRTGRLCCPESAS